MKGQKKESAALGRVMEILERYKFVLLIVLVGAALLLWPEGQTGAVLKEKVTVAEASGEAFDLEAMERKISAALSQIEGAGNATVLLTVKNSPRNVLAEDKNASAQEGSSKKAVETVVISTGAGSQSPVLLEQVYPEFQGALVICDGGDEINVRLSMMEAVSALTGLGADKICICKGK